MIFNNVKISYGYHDRHEDDEKTEFAVEKLKERFGKYPNFHIKKVDGAGTHVKMVLCDNKFYLHGSYNVLSFAGVYGKDANNGDSATRDESMTFGTDVDFIKKLRDYNFNWN